jgi:dynein heavy chain 1
MFAGITGLECNNNNSSNGSGDNSTITTTTTTSVVSTVSTAMISKEGENVPFTSTSIDLTVPVKDWLIILESNMVVTLSTLLQQAIEESLKLVYQTSSSSSSSSSGIGDKRGNEDDSSNYVNNEYGSDRNTLLQWMNLFPAQIIILSSQITWTSDIEESLNSSSSNNNTYKTNNNNIDNSGTTASSNNNHNSYHIMTKATLNRFENKLLLLTQYILINLSSSLRKKCEQLLTEMVYQRDVLRALIDDSIISITDFQWLYHLRFYWKKSTSHDGNGSSNQPQQQLSIKISNAIFNYGFEYLGIGERLVQTPLTDRCYLTLTQALHYRLGGNPFGPAGTGKTESVKMLGSQLGRFVIVFNCDSSFDYTAMSRIFAGLCQVGAWGCFDEFNRLEERILSAVSQQILTIQRGLQLHQSAIELFPGNQCQLSSNVGIFITMNPGYAGRSNLPDNLKQLFRTVAMTIPDRKLIAQVMLFRSV